MTALTGMKFVKGKDPDDLAINVTAAMLDGGVPFGGIFHHGPDILCQAIELNDGSAATVTNTEGTAPLTSVDGVTPVTDTQSNDISVGPFFVADGSITGAGLDSALAIVLNGAAPASSIAVSGVYVNTVTFHVANNVLTGITLS